jgi:putative addiction module killer protein
MTDIRHFATASSEDVFQGWFDTLRDRQAQARIQARIDRLERGLFGDAEPVR